MATTYTNLTDLTAYTTTTVPQGAAGDALINKAERDIDAMVGPWRQNSTVGNLTLPTSTIKVNSTSTFAQSGTIVIEGQSVTYTAKTADTFTGCSGGTGTIVEGSIVMQRGATGLKFDPISQLSTFQQTALNRATCAQAEYRLTMGESFFTQAQYSAVSGPDFSYKGSLPPVGPKVTQELEGFGLAIAVLVA